MFNKIFERIHCKPQILTKNNKYLFETELIQNRWIKLLPERMGKNEDVKLFFEIVIGIFRFLPIVESTVAAVVFLGNRLTKIFVKIFQQFSEKVKKLLK